MSGFQGYLTSRPLQGFRVPQHVQNLVMRDYCETQGMTYMLSGTEYAIPGSFLILNQMVDRLDELDGIVFYSMFQLPEEACLRHNIYDEFLCRDKSMHFAVEMLSLSAQIDLQRIEDIWSVFLVMRDIPNIQDQL